MDQIPIEARSPEEVTRIQGRLASPGAAEDPARVQITATLITKAGVAPASEAGLRGLQRP